MAGTGTPRRSGRIVPCRVVVVVDELDGDLRVGHRGRRDAHPGPVEELRGAGKDCTMTTPTDLLGAQHRARVYGRGHVVGGVNTASAPVGCLDATVLTLRGL